MNDFTKEELLDLYEGVGWLREAIGSDPDLIKLTSKVKSLIDNYCEHESIENIGGWVQKCTKCGMKFGDETQ